MNPLLDLELFRRRLVEDCGLNPQGLILTGISGGADSLCLMHLLHSAGFRQVAAHFDHALRPESAQDALKVQHMAQALGVPLVSGRGDVPTLARAGRMGVEEAAREARYEFLFRAARQHAAQAVAVGHNADDQVETVLMHLLRGAGLPGLKGMQMRSVLAEWDAEIPLVRPLLETWRAEISEYCVLHGLEPLQDASNRSNVFFRNRLRNQVIPALEAAAPGARRSLQRMSQVLAQDHACLEKLAQSAWEDCRLEEGECRVVFSRRRLLAQHPALQSRLLRRALFQLQPRQRDVDSQTVERACTWLQDPPRGASAELCGGLVLSFEGDRASIHRGALVPDAERYPQVAGESGVPLPGELSLGEGWLLRAEVLAVPPQGLERPADEWSACLDASALGEGLTLRTGSPGERFEPLGMGGRSMKLSDFWINQKLPRRARAGYPVVCAGVKIAWIPGLRLAEFARLTPLSRQAVCLSLSRHR